MERQTKEFGKEVGEGLPHGVGGGALLKEVYARQCKPEGVSLLAKSAAAALFLLVVNAG